MNDAFVIPCIESGLYNNNELFVYNQWGDEVYAAQTYGNDWQGTFNGNDLPTGTYYYVFKPNPQTDPIKGFLILER
jgi:gliding motility-associated-like protein